MLAVEECTDVSFQPETSCSDAHDVSNMLRGLRCNVNNWETMIMKVQQAASLT